MILGLRSLSNSINFEHIYNVFILFCIRSRCYNGKNNFFLYILHVLKKFTDLQ